MKICLVSLFRDSATYLPTYLQQCRDLFEGASPNEVQFLWGVGDCTDDTEDYLHEAAELLPATIFDCSIGSEAFGSIEHKERFKQLAQLGNMWITHLPEDVTYVIYVESDLIWEWQELYNLIPYVTPWRAACPKVYLLRYGYPEDAWYDTWATRIDGKNYGHYYPYHKQHNKAGPTQVDSSGSCMAFTYSLITQLHFPEEDLFVGLCRQVYELGGDILLTNSVVIHQ